MNILLALLPLSLLLLGIAIWSFLRAVRGGQFDDLDTPPLDMLGDDARPRPPGSRTPSDVAAPGTVVDAPPDAPPEGRD